MRQSLALLLIAFSIPSSTPLLAQQQSHPLLGVGMSIDPARLGQTNYFYSSLEGVQTQFSTTESPILFYVPITIATMARIEPSFGIYSARNKTNRSSTQPGTGYPQTYTTTGSVVTLGVRGTYISRPSDHFALYVGPRLDFNFVSSTSEYSYFSGYPVANTKYTYKATADETDITIGAVAGAEYFPLPQFSIGGEVSLNYLSFGDPDETREEFPPPSPPQATVTTEREKHILRTDALFFLRWYFLHSQDDAVGP